MNTRSYNKHSRDLEGEMKVLRKELNQIRGDLEKAEEQMFRACLKAGQMMLGIDLAREPDQSGFHLIRVNDQGQRVMMNMNDLVSVQLTEYGHQLHVKTYTDLKLSPPTINEDDEGWSVWQLHELMSTFGHALVPGSSKQPFKMDFILHPPSLD